MRLNNNARPNYKKSNLKLTNRFKSKMTRKIYHDNKNQKETETDDIR